MDTGDQLRALAARAPKIAEQLRTEEATKTALVLPFLQGLGYNVFDPTELTPELDADVGVKKGEKVDYAILREGKPVILIECKAAAANLDTITPTQLYRYFSVTEARFGVLTNGLLYRFFTDLEEPNKMDSKPFFEFNLLDINDASIEDVKRFAKGSFDIEETLSAASDLKYTKEIKRILASQLVTPSDEFVRFLAAQVYPGKLVERVRVQFTEVTKRAFRQFINDEIGARLKSALATSPGDQAVAANKPESELTEPDGSIVTSQEELEGYLVVKAVVRDLVDPGRITLRDAKRFCNILFDDNIRKPICRLWFNAEQKYLGLIDRDKNDEKVPISDINGIYKHADKIRERVRLYVEEKRKPEQATTKSDMEKADA